MESKNKNQSIDEAQRSASLRDAWSRFVDYSETPDDLKLISESIRKGEDLHEYREVMNRIADETFRKNIPLDPQERKKYIREARRMYVELKRKQKIRMSSVSSPTIVRFRKIWYAAAAALLLGLLIPAVRLLVKPKTEQVAIQYIIEATGRGEIKTIVLPDQTKVTLNVESILKYPDVFASERAVELQGGAIFEVTPDSERPFTVATTDMNVSVLGTVFDVKAYPDDELLMVSVASGKVVVAMGHAPLSSHAPLQLEKNHQLKIDKATGHVEKLTIDAEKYLSWTDGVLYFNKTPMKEVVNMLNRSYPRMVFELAEDEYPNLITGRFDIKEMEPMLGLFFRSFGIQYKKAGNKIILYHK